MFVLERSADRAHRRGRPARAESRAVVAALKKLGIDVAMVTGDSRTTADAIAAHVGITEVYAEVLPSEKASIVKRIQASGRKIACRRWYQRRAALAQADVGIAVATAPTSRWRR